MSQGCTPNVNGIILDIEITDDQYSVPCEASLARIVEGEIRNYEQRWAQYDVANNIILCDFRHELVLPLCWTWINKYLSTVMLFVRTELLS